MYRSVLVLVVSVSVSLTPFASREAAAGTSRASILDTVAIAKGAFASTTLSIAMPLGDISEYTRVCNLPHPDGGYSSLNWGPPMNDAVVTPTVQ